MSEEIGVTINLIVRDIYALMPEDSDKACEFIIELAEILEDRKAVSETFLESLLVRLRYKIGNYDASK